MEEDDEFGDLYTDVLRPLETSIQFRTVETDAPASLRSRPIDPDVNSDDEEILDGAADLKNPISNSSSSPRIRFNSSIQEKTLPERRDPPELGGFNLNLDSNSNPKVSRIVDSDDGLEAEATVSEKGRGVKLPEMRSSGGLDFVEEDDDLDIVVEERETKDDDLVEKNVNCVDALGNMHGSSEQNEYADNYAHQGEAVGEMGSQQMIPGLSRTLENQGGSNLEDEWDSDESEDDLQIVLNDNNRGPMGMEMLAGVDDDGDGGQLVIVADNGDVSHHQQQQPMLNEQERKGEELGPGADGERKELGDANKASGVLPKVGYSNNLYHHHSIHSQFKYVRPGAAPLPGAVPVTPGGIQGQVRPPITLGPGAGRGRGDWRPRGPVPMQKGHHPGYGMPVWGPNAVGRGYGSGLDFTLPSHKTIFEIDIDGFEEKPWRLPGIDISDFFNFSLNEDSWKDYCKQLEQLRLETTMQSKIRVYESGRTEQDFDPDLPPELAAAVENQDIPSENANAGMSGAAGSLDLARASARVPPAAPIGRPIPVETGTGDRFPSVDTRRPRMHDSDAIIEIICQNSNDDGMEELDNDLGGEGHGGLDDVDELQRDDANRNNFISHAPNGQKGEIVARRVVRHDETGRDGDPHEARFTKKSGQIKSSKTNDSDDDDGENQVTDNQSESFNSEDGKRNRPLPPSHAIESDGEQAVSVGDDVNGDSVMDDRSFETERQDMDVDATNSDALEDGKLRRLTNKRTVNGEGEDYKPARSSDNRSRSSKDADRVVQDSHRPRSGSVTRPPLRDDDNNARRKSYHISGKGREDSHSQRGGVLNSFSQHHHMKSENNTDWRKRVRVEDTRKREHGGEIGSRNWGRGERDDERHGSWVGENYDQDMGLRQRDRDDSLKNRSEKVDDVHGKRRKEGAYMSREYGEKEEMAYNHRESSSSRRKRERDGHAKFKDNDMSYDRQKGEGSFQKERGERQRDRDEWHRREREDIRPVMRSGRPAEDKKWTSHSRGKDDYKGSGREYHSKNVGRHSDQAKRRERIEDDSFSQNRGHEDANARGNQGSGYDEKRATYVRPGTSNEHDVYASDTSRLREHRREGSRKGKEFESGERSSLIPSKRNQDEQSGHIKEMVNSRGTTEQTNIENDTHENQQSSRKHRKEASSDDEQATDSRKGRSKLERWTSHLERDFSTTKTSLSSSSKKSKHLDTNNSGEAPLPSKKAEDDKDASDETNNANAKATEDNTHTDTVEKLKKRRERFKLPMPSEKEALAIKKIANEPLPSPAQTENHPDSEIKPERPARKRRWTGN